ncbi:ABC transporter permease [Puia dinghuensis]|uniref:ABC transporter permease n=1 Tax=Puia dinghuensis TaxID=1792502 RepID=A0A8J2XT73_9BACT|nr:ABC transporter permease [Puia dinghuensis]GGB01014.1 ABC transporter permease [Puia dinghuensis]
MLKNFWKIALRQLGKQKFYSAVKIGGFALGIAACLLIGLYVHNQLSYDRDFPGADRLYRLAGYISENGKVRKGSGWQAPFAQALKTEFPQVERTGRLMSSNLFYGAGSNQLRPIESTRDSYEQGFAYADSSLPDLFQFQMVYGDRTKALMQPQTLILSKSKADKFYPGQNPVGRQIILNDDKDHPWTIGGVMQDPPEHTHLQFDYYLSLTGHELWKGEQQTWMASNYDIYLRLRPDADTGKLAILITSTIKNKYWIPAMQQNGQPDAATAIKSLGFMLQPVSDIHLAADFEDGMPHVDRKYLWLFGAIGVFVLLLASINFINLSTARSANRAKEVGLRKVVGSDRQGLVRQFLLESIVTSGFSFLLAIGLAALLLPLFNRLAGTSMHFPWAAWWLVPGVVGASVVIGLIAGLYPAFYLSAFRPVQVLKGDISRGARHSGLRSGLVVFQFTTSVVLIIATIVVYGQMHFILNSKMGFNKDQVLLIQGTGSLGDKLPAFKNELLQLSGVQAVTNSDFLPISGSKRNGNTMYRVGREKLDPGTSLQRWDVDVDYLKVMGIKLVEGRNFSPSLASDSQAVIINQTMARKMGMTHPIGERINWGQGQGVLVIGVVEDFNYESVKQPIGSLMLILGNWTTTVAVRTHTTDMKGLLAGVDKVWRGFAPQQTLRYTFLDQSFEHMYADVQQTGNIFTSLATLAVCIACLGLFALSAFMAEQRRKEMGIRKVLGASVMEVAGLLSRDFLRLVALAIVIGSPIAWWMMHWWLQDYVYRITIGAGIFIGAAVLVMVIALLTVSWQALKTGTTNPAVALRSE